MINWDIKCLVVCGAKHESPVVTAGFTVIWSSGIERLLSNPSGQRAAQSWWQQTLPLGGWMLKACLCLEPSRGSSDFSSVSWSVRLTPRWCVSNKVPKIVLLRLTDLALALFPAPISFPRLSVGIHSNLLRQKVDDLILTLSSTSNVAGKTWSRSGATSKDWRSDSVCLGGHGCSRTLPCLRQYCQRCKLFSYRRAQTSQTRSWRRVGNKHQWVLMFGAFVASCHHLECPWSVNFEAAGTAKDYVHRIGRTGRAGNKGVAYTLLLRNEDRKAEDIVQVLTCWGESVRLLPSKVACYLCHVLTNFFLTYMPHVFQASF